MTLLSSGRSKSDADSGIAGGRSQPELVLRTSPLQRRICFERHAAHSQRLALSERLWQERLTSGEGFADWVQLRWSFNGTGPKIDAICSADSVSPAGVTVSCSKFAAHIADEPHGGSASRVEVQFHRRTFIAVLTAFVDVGGCPEPAEGGRAL